MRKPEEAGIEDDGVSNTSLPSVDRGPDIVERSRLVAVAVVVVVVAYQLPLSPNKPISGIDHSHNIIATQDKIVPIVQL